ncbi:CATRA conflict system CASPASE/TPR repeat-associated protein [Actinoplanes derwentensis]|uniref:Predicted nucleotide-binding protein containing TIR-like domain-containing protein n=1 Tax=Actinoplanes derwentensis TaxID=113562 RepID=A0A1H1Y8E9_9ACTN|nr:CATRA conflict system CASPASE/TPR repeat-associated protein [Actinoplanes derwentensis]GID86694.1 hypothetical protein Ade03nite_56180 [Actinoplanes derwentensis]SDT17286.1 Predicted nucleotide-binding protein containing TIR-like domain-containing protein [Actinoplanes derwentensis]
MAPAADQELVIHLFARSEGPSAVTAYAEIRAIWDRCRDVLGLTVPLAGVGLPTDLPTVLPRDPGELVVAARKHPGLLYQAILRRFPTTVNLSVVLSPGPGGPGWRDLDRLWQSVAGPWSGTLLGVAYLFLGKSADLTCTERDAADLPVSGPVGWWFHGVPTADGFALWEPGVHDADGRAERRFLVLARPDEDDRLADWTWSSGVPVLPPLGHHLRHAAVLRHQVRVWQRADGLRRVQDRLDDGGDPAEVRRDIAYWRSALRDMRRTVKNLETAIHEVGGAEAGPLADDLAVAVWFRGALKDDLAALAVADERAAALSTLPIPSGEIEPMPDPRHVFVIHGRDEQARSALWTFLQAIDLHPLDWEEVVQRTGAPSPYMGEVLAKAFESNQAAIVLMTPDDGALLHESLRNRGDRDFEGKLTGQVRPNVLLEAGMALAVQRDRTIIIEIGDLRPVSDLAGINTIHFNGTVASLHKIAQRLRGAGCAVNTDGTDWLDATRFTDLDAYDRKF